MKRGSKRYAVIFALVAAVAVATGAAASTTAKPPLGRCTMALPATRSTIEVQIPDAADFCELVSQALAVELFKAPTLVMPGRLWHYPGAALSCRLRYRRTSDRVSIHNADAACGWFLGLAPGWHREAAVGLPGVRPLRGFGTHGHPLRRKPALGDRPTAHGAAVRVVLRPRVIDLFRHASVAVSGTSAQAVSVRLKGATDEAGPAYEWTPYRWRRLQLRHGTWHGVLPSPALLGVYQLQLRLQHEHEVVQSRHWLLRVFRPGTLNPLRPSFAAPVGVIRDLVRHLPGSEVLVAVKRWPQAAFDHRDRRLNRIYAVAYAPRDRTAPSLRRGLFITTVRDGFSGKWRLLEATVEPYGERTPAVR